jgi:hypothetical protein
LFIVQTNAALAIAMIAQFDAETAILVIVIAPETN